MDRLALHRRRAVAQGLAEAIELLVISVEAGLSLDDAINRRASALAAGNGGRAGVDRRGSENPAEPR
jgi:Flp pilus assembly protein TadB